MEGQIDRRKDGQTVFLPILQGLLEGPGGLPEGPEGLLEGSEGLLEGSEGLPERSGTFQKGLRAMKAYQRGLIAC